MARRSQPRERPPRRPRRSPEEARRLILDAAEKRLREGGPDAIRLQEIARDVGISHPTLLHHFRSREGLTRALAERAIENLRGDLVAALEGAPGEGEALRMLDRVFDTLGDAGHARLLAWRELAGAARPRAQGGPPGMLEALVDRVQRRRVEDARRAGAAPPPREDSEFAVRLAAAALLGDALFGRALDESVGRAPDAARRRRFRAWLARLLLEHLGREGEDDAGAT